MTANPPFRTIQLQRDTAANWTSANTLLAEGELGLEMDTRKAKIGDWVTNWNLLDYAFESFDWLVHDTWDEIIWGVKTFSSSPIVPTPTTATQAVNKEYADYTPDFYKYSIVTSVASGNLTVALKNFEGNDPTASKPVKIQIGDTVRTLSRALSYVANSWINYFNLWSAELATKEADIFVYLRWDTWSNQIELDVSRYPNATVSWDFVQNNFNEKWYWVSAFAWSPTTDKEQNIGRFNAILSAGAWYTWSIPAKSVVINSPTFFTITNKRVVVVTTQSATPTINTDNGDIFQITGLAQAITSMTTNLSWTPVAWDMIMIQITDNGSARAITWWASFASTTVNLPTTTVISTMLRVLFQRNNANTAWDCIATV